MMYVSMEEHVWNTRRVTGPAAAHIAKIGTVGSNGKRRDSLPLPEYIEPKSDIIQSRERYRHSMIADSTGSLKDQIRGYWDHQACGTQFSTSNKFSREYFDEIEEHRYAVEPEIHSFAQFTRHHGARLLEVGIGAGTDFVQWVRAGTVAYGIDATEAGVEHVRHRLERYGLRAEDVRIADCEHLPFDDDSFDIVYSWGVIHHTPDTPAAMREIVRVCRPGGRCKVMIYHRHSLFTFFVWVRRALLAGKPWRSFRYCLWNNMESIGTKAFTSREVHKMLAGQPVVGVVVKPILTYYDRMARFNAVFRGSARFLAWLLGGNRVGWFLTIEFMKVTTPSQ